MQTIDVNLNPLAQSPNLIVSTPTQIDQGGSIALSIIAAGVVIGLLYWARSVFITATIAVILALILEPFVSLLVRLRFPRSIATFAKQGTRACARARRREISRRMR